LEQAAAELFRRCDRLREEMGDQVRQMAELSERIQRNDLSAEDDDRDRNSRCENRITKARDRQRSLSERYELLRRKVGHATAGGRELTNKEKAWISEITSLGENFGVDSEMEVDVVDAQPDKNMEDRFEMVCAERTFHIHCSRSLIRSFYRCAILRIPSSTKQPKYRSPRNSILQRLTKGVYFVPPPALLRRCHASLI
jgi:hypothetical protein